MHHGNSNSEHEYYMNETKLRKVNEEKDLGVRTERTMKPAKQYEMAAKMANRVL